MLYKLHSAAGVGCRQTSTRSTKKCTISFMLECPQLASVRRWAATILSEWSNSRVNLDLACLLGHSYHPLGHQRSKQTPEKGVAHCEMFTPRCHLDELL